MNVVGASHNQYVLTMTGSFAFFWDRSYYSIGRVSHRVKVRLLPYNLDDYRLMLGIASLFTGVRLCLLTLLRSYIG